MQLVIYLARILETILIGCRDTLNKLFGPRVLPNRGLLKPSPGSSSRKHFGDFMGITVALVRLDMSTFLFLKAMFDIVL